MSSKYYDVSVITTTIHEDKIRAYYLSEDDKESLNADLPTQDDEITVLEITDIQSFCDKNFSEDLFRFETNLVMSMIVGISEDMKAHATTIKNEYMLSHEASRLTMKALGNLPKAPKEIKEIASRCLQVFQQHRSDSGVKFSNDYRLLIFKEMPDYTPAFNDDNRSEESLAPRLS